MLEKAKYLIKPDLKKEYQEVQKLLQIPALRLGQKALQFQQVLKQLYLVFVK